MAGYPFYLASLLFVALWHASERQVRLGRLFGYLVVGILLARVLPLLQGLVMSAPDRDPSRAQALFLLWFIWAGSLLSLRAMLGLSLWGRRRSLWNWLWGGLLVLILLLVGRAELPNARLLLLALPWFFRAYTWRDYQLHEPISVANDEESKRRRKSLVPHGLGAGALGLIVAGAVLAIPIFALTVSPNLESLSRPNFLRTVTTLQALASVMGIVLALGTVFALAGRIHLSIRNIGRRLVASHLLAGFVPLALAVLFMLLAGSFFLSTYRGQVGTRILGDASARAEQRLEQRFQASGRIDPAPFGFSDAPTVIVVREGQQPARVLRTETGESVRFHFDPDSLLANPSDTPEVPLIYDGTTLFLRARVDLVQAGVPFRVEALTPVDSVRLIAVSDAVGVPVRISPRLTIMSSRRGVSISDSDDPPPAARPGDTVPVESEGRLESAPRPPAPPAIDIGDAVTDLTQMMADSMRNAPSDSLRDAIQRRMQHRLRTMADSLRARADDEPDSDEADDSTSGTGNWTESIGPRGKGKSLPGGATIHCLRWRRDRFSLDRIPISSSASFAEPVTALFSTRKENPIAIVVLIGLAFIGVLFIGTIWITASMVAGMVRTVTRAVEVLKEATTAIGEGRLHHRIRLEGRDELWSVAGSFNQMAEGLERERALAADKQRLEDELRLAREIQDRLLPDAPPDIAALDLAGRSLPARHVGGDYFDYLLLDGGKVGIAVADVSGKGAAAALLMSSFRASLRSLDLAALGPGESLARLNRFVHSSVDPGKFITAFLGVLDPASGQLSYAVAGHEPPYLLHVDGSTEELAVGGLVLGLFPEARYEEGQAEMRTGSLLAVFTDGVTEAQNPSGEFFGGERLLAELKRSRGATCSGTLEHIVKDVQAFAGAAAQFDDITLVLARRN